MFIRSTRVFIDGKLRPACLSIHTERIGGVHSYTYMKEEALDAGDWIILPAGIDVHTHMREPESPQKEDFTTGSQAAIAGGTTVFLDMPCYKNPPTTTVGALTAKERLATQKSVCDFGFHFGASDENSDLIKRLQPSSLKAFLAETNSKLTLSKSGFERHFAGYDSKKPFLVHCEDPEIIEKNSKKYSSHEDIHDQRAALEGVKYIKELAQKFKRRVHFVHMSTAAEVKAAKAGGLTLEPTIAGEKPLPLHTVEICTHHLFLSTSDLERLKGYGIVNPPLRKRAEVAKLWSQLKTADCVATDHAPHTPEDKAAGAPGFPGIQTMYPLMLHAALGKKISIEQAVRLCSEGPASAFTLHRKGKIAPGYDADLILFDPKDSWHISSDSLFSKAGWSPYEGWTLRGKILGTFLRGEQVYWDGEILVKPGYGERAQRADQIGTERLVLRKHAKER
ncbi:MAG: amidohydrolase family protein [Candidatus Micrarchaeota archaeon]